MARHGRSQAQRRALLQRVGLGLAFLLVVALVPALLVTRPDRDPAAAPPAPTTTGAAPTTTTPAPRPSPTRLPPTTRPPVAAPVATGPPPPRTPFQEFPSVCAPAGRGTRPVPGRGAVAGDWFGLAPGTAGTSCLYAADRSAYWVPSVSAGGTVLTPERAEVYYKSGIRDYSLVRPFPAGLALLSGTAAEAAARGAFASWSCGEGDALELPTRCPPGNRLALRLQAPSCWDGRRLTSPDERSHLAWPLDDRCPGGHPVPVPKLELVVWYPLPPGPPRLSVATGAAGVVFRFTDGWAPAAQARLVRTCVNRGLRCNSDGVQP